MDRDAQVKAEADRLNGQMEGWGAMTPGERADALSYAVLSLDGRRLREAAVRFVREPAGA